MLEKENVHVFIKKARFAEWQKKFVMDAWEIALKELRVLAALEKWLAKLSPRDGKEYAAIINKMYAAIMHELPMWQ